MGIGAGRRGVSSPGHDGCHDSVGCVGGVDRAVPVRREEGRRKPKPLQTMLRIYLLQVWFALSDEGVEDAVYDSCAMRRRMNVDFAVGQVPDATTLLHFRHLIEKHGLGEKLFAAQTDLFDANGWIMRGGSIVDATIIAAPSSTKNATGERDAQMLQTKKGQQWCFGMKAHIGVDAGTGYIHSVTATAANVHDLDEIPNLVRDDDRVVYADAGYQGVDKREEVTGDPHLSGVHFRVAARKSKLAAMPAPDRAEQTRLASVRSKVEHPFLIVKRDFRVHRDPLPRHEEEPEPSTHAVRVRELADACPCRCPDRVTAGASLPGNGQRPRNRGRRHSHRGNQPRNATRHDQLPQNRKTAANQRFLTLRQGLHPGVTSSGCASTTSTPRWPP